MEEFDSDFFSHQLFQGRLGWAGAPRPPQELRKRAASSGRTDPESSSGTFVDTLGGGMGLTKQTKLLTRLSQEGLAPWPRLPRFANFPFHFPFRGEKGSGPKAEGKGHQHTSDACPRRCFTKIWETGGSEPKKRRAEIASRRPETQKSLSVSGLRPPAPAASRGGLNAQEQSFVSASDRIF